MSFYQLLIIAIGIAGAVYGFFHLGVQLGREEVTEEFQDDAVKQGHAEYYLDSNNERQWRWKQ